MSDTVTILGMDFTGDARPWIEFKGDFSDAFWKKAWEEGAFDEYFPKIEHDSFKWHVIELLGIRDIEVDEDGRRSYRGVNLGRLQDGFNVVRRVEFTEDNFHLEFRAGFYGIPLDTEIRITVSVKGEEREVKQQYLNGYNQLKTRDRAVEAEFDLPLAGIDGAAMQIFAYVDGVRLHMDKFMFGKYCFLAGNLPGGYYASNGWVVTSEKDFSTFYVEQCPEGMEQEYEKNFCKKLKASGLKDARKSVMVRKMAFALRRRKKKPICLISDRVSKADDNGEAFFRYMRENHADEIDSYFIIDGKSADFQRLKQYGNVVPFFSWKHRFLHLRADYLVSSQVNDYFFNPFRGAQRVYKNMLDGYKYVFLQHGIISNDLSDWLRKQKKYLDGFVVTTQEEYERVLGGNYDYTDKEIWLTGLPRYDYLEDRPEKIVTLLPTWRMYLAKKQDPVTGYWILVDNFRDTTYAKFYRELLSNDKLNEAAKRLGYKIQFKLHPSFTGLEHEFGFPDYADIIYEDTTYREMYARSNLIVSDYSSAIYDFLYLRKPIFYTQPDADEFFAGKHIYEKGDFDYETQGFGEVEYTLEGTVDRIIEYMENDCQLKDKYRQRIEEFFVFNDRKNCERIYERMTEKD